MTAIYLTAEQNQLLVTDLIKRGEITDPASAKGRLLHCAAILFRQEGYERTTVRDLAKKVGIQSGSLFHHYPSKEQILLAAMKETICFNTERMKKALELNSGAKDRLQALIRCELESILGDTGTGMTILVYEWRSLKPENQQVILELRDQYEKLWMSALEEAKAEELSVIDPFILRRLLTGAISWTVNWYKDNGSVSIEELSEMTLTLAIK